MRRGRCRIRGVVLLSLLVAAPPVRSGGDGGEPEASSVVAEGSVGSEAAAEPSSGADADATSVERIPPGEPDGRTSQPEAPTDARPPMAESAGEDAPVEPSAPVATVDAGESQKESGSAEVGKSAGDPGPTGDHEVRPAEKDRVRLRLDVEGEIFATVGADSPPLRLPTKLEARFDFTESPATADDGFRVERRYVDAAADLTVAGTPRRIALAADARVVRFAVLGTTPVPFLAAGHLTREELDLLETPFDPLLASAIRPSAAVTEGEAWEIPADATAGLLAIDTVESGRLEARLTGVVDGVATVTISGIVDGAADGVPSHVTVEGSCMVPATVASDGAFNLDRAPRSAAVTIRERREAGHVSPGFDVEAHVSFARESAVAIESHDARADETVVRRGGPGKPGLVWHRDSLGRFEIVHDGRWKTIEDGLDGLVMRLVDHGALIAQCSVTALPRGPVADPPTIATVERDLQRSLAGQATGIEHSSEASRSDGVRIVRVVATGRAGDLPFRWVHAVLTDTGGHRVAVTCMLEASLRERFGTADRDLVDGISLPGADGAGQGGAAEPIAREARLPPDSPQP